MGGGGGGGGTRGTCPPLSDDSLNIHECILRTARRPGEGAGGAGADTGFQTRGGGVCL